MNKFISLTVTILILALSIAFVVMPKSDFSENENRMLQEFPELTFESFASGEYMEDITLYISDHFPLRNGFVTLKTLFAEKIMGSRLINGIYICGDMYIEDYNRPENTDRLIATFNKFCKNLEGKKVDLMLVPTAIEIYGDRLPRFASPLSQLKTMDKIYSSVECNNIDSLYDALRLEKEKGRKLFYSLDHHWTTEGAYVGYTAYCKAKGIEPQPESAFDIKTVTDDFKGTVYSKLNDITLKGEEIKVYDQDNDITVLYDGVESNSLYNYDYLEKKDKYSLFLNNIHSLVEITNNKTDSTRTLAIAKDSYANSMIPFLVKHYKKIYVFDTRSYKGAVSDFVKENNIDDVLILYNMNTIDTDTGVNVIY